MHLGRCSGKLHLIVRVWQPIGLDCTSRLVYRRPPLWKKRKGLGLPIHCLDLTRNTFASRASNQRAGSHIGRIQSKRGCATSVYRARGALAVRALQMVLDHIVCMAVSSLQSEQGEVVVDCPCMP